MLRNLVNKSQIRLFLGKQATNYLFVAWTCSLHEKYLSIPWYASRKELKVAVNRLYACSQNRVGESLVWKVWNLLVTGAILQSSQSNFSPVSNEDTFKDSFSFQRRCSLPRLAREIKLR